MRQRQLLNGITGALIICVFVTTHLYGQNAGSAGGKYKGSPFGDERVAAAPQVIPGKIICAYYDTGGQGVAYHDTSETNEGSGKLNPIDGSYLNGFRVKEGVDISYTKQLDFTPENIVDPDSIGALYVGWTDPGEWLNYTVDVKESGIYSIDFFYSAAVEAAISISIDGKDETGLLKIPTTKSPHQWNRINNI
ncbi:MAG: carbohydrate-binding protein, partial [Tannerellaceae bacterium]|nr:carbohydrate-binding protein [Tannerellaceae bacterium]